MSVGRFSEEDKRPVRFVELVAQGSNPNAAARAAGYADPDRASRDLMKNVLIKHMLDVARRASSPELQVTRNKVTEMVMEAYETAKIQADASSMVRAASELSRMNGYYEPERKVVDISMTLAQKKERLAELTDEELLELAHQSSKVIEGEFEEVG